jgi:hypothetical protein
MERDLRPLRSEVGDLAAKLFTVIAIPFENTSELQRQVLAAFSFGMVFAVGQVHRLSPAEVHALGLCLLSDVFRYSPEQSAAFAAELISAASDRSVQPTTNAIIHRGIDGHAQIESGSTAALRANVVGVLKAVGGWRASAPG